MRMVERGTLLLAIAAVAALAQITPPSVMISSNTKGGGEAAKAAAAVVAQLESRLRKELASPAAIRYARSQRTVTRKPMRRRVRPTLKRLPGCASIRRRRALKSTCFIRF